MTLSGPQAREAFKTADTLVKEGRLEEARSIPLLPSDRQVIEKRIEERIRVGANDTKERT